MKDQVNFYQPSLKPGSESVNLNLVLICCLIATVLVTSWSIYSSVGLEQWQAREKAQKQDLENIRQKLQQVTANLDTQPDIALVQQAEQLQRQIQAQNSLLGRLRNEQQTGRGTYAQLMLALASQHQEDIWLTHIAVTGNRLQLQGKSLSAESVPRWLKSLSESDYFIGTRFGSLKVFRDEEQLLNFILGATELQPDKTLRPES
jgi:Tfp pilus assembly protein PilN